MNLMEREDRYEIVQLSFKKMGIEPTFYRFNRDRHTGGNFGIYCIFSDLLKKNPELEYLWYFEDDVVFHGSKEDIVKVFGELPADWEIFYLGGSLMKPSKLVTDHLIKLNGFFATHATCFKACVMREIVDKQAEYMDIDPLDVWINNNIIPRGNCYMSYPMLATQMASYSDIEGRIVNYDWQLNDQIDKNLIK